MKRVRITIDPTEVALPRAYERLTGAPYLDRARIVNWNVSEPPTGFLLWIRGDYRQFGAELDEDPAVHEHEVLPAGDRECYCFLRGDATAAARTLFENFTRGSLMTVPPIELARDGTSTFTLVGTDADIQDAVEGIPDPVGVTVESVGDGRVADQGVVGRLSPRQREAVETALRIGYYDVPRSATVEDVADRLDCATATAGEHLQKAESTVLAALFEA